MESNLKADAAAGHKKKREPGKCKSPPKKLRFEECHLPSCSKVPPCCCRFLIRINNKATGKPEDELIMKLTISQLVWTMKNLECQNNEETLKLIGVMCNGLDDIVDLSSLQFSDTEFNHLLNMFAVLLSLIKGFEGGRPLTMLTQINDRVELVFDNFLKQLSPDNGPSFAAHKLLICQGYINGILFSFDNQSIRKKLIQKQFFKILTVILKLWKNHFPKNARKTGNEKWDTLERKIDRYEDFNLFYFYCQILEALIISMPESSEDWIENWLSRTLQSTKEVVDNFFQIFPNLSIIFYSVIIAAQARKKEDQEKQK